MVSNFNFNNVFETELTAGWEFNFDDNIIDKNDFTHNTITNRYEYSNTFTLLHFNALQNVESISKIDLTFHQSHTTDINLRFSYSLDNNTFSNIMDIDEINLSLISNVKYLWLKIEVTIEYDLDYLPIENIPLPLATVFVAGKRYLDQIFSAESLQPGTLKVFTSQDTYKVFNTTSYKVYLQSGNESDLEIYFRYTQNQGRNWTQWLKLTDANLQRQQYIKVKFCDFQFGFRNISLHSIDLYDLELIGEFQNVTGNYKLLNRFGLKTQCNPLVNNESPCSCDDEVSTSDFGCSPCSAGYTPWNSDLTSTCLANNVANINDVNMHLGLIETQQILNEYVEAKNHWPFDYFYTDPDKKGIDTILNENALTNVIMKRTMKVIVPDNQFPTDQITFSGFGMDLIVSFEVHILKSTFKKMFGVESRPRKGDYMFLCNTNLVYEVEQTLDKKDVMNASFYWRVILKKYENKASRKFAKTVDGDEAKSFTDTIVKYTTLDDLFSDENAVEISQISLNKNDNDNIDSKSQQATDLVDGTYTLYKEFNNKVERNVEDMWNASVRVSTVQYKLPMKSKNIKHVIYDDYYKDNIVDNINNRAFSMWFKTEDYNPLYDYTLLSNYDYTNNVGYKINLFNGALSITINTDTYSVPVNITNDVWYSFYIGLDQSKETIEMSVYKRQSENGKSLSNNQLLKVAGNNFTLNLFTFNHDESIFIGGCDTFNINNNRNSYYMTNIAIWREPISKSKRSAVLNQSKFTDGHLILLADDAIKPLNLPFYGNI